MKVWRIGIIGGGPGGLMTAYSIQRWSDSPHRITLYEASSRLGGKIQTPSFSSAPWPYEAGAAEFYDYSSFDEDPLKELILELGLSVRPMGGPAVAMHDRVLSNVDEVRSELGSDATAALEAFDRVAKDQVTPLEFYYSGEESSVGERAEKGSFAPLLEQISHPLTRRYVECMIHSDLAAEPTQTSLHYGLQNYLMNDSAYMNLYGIVGGNELLPRRLAESITADIRLNHRVTRISRGEQGIRIEAEYEHASTSEEFDFVIVALPHNHFDKVEYVGERLSHSMAAHHAHYDHPAHYLRVTMLFETPFWRNSFADSYWMLDAFGGCCLYDESSRQPENPFGILGWLIAGDAALQMSAWSDEALIQAALDSLPAHWGPAKTQLKEAHVHRWISSVNAMPGGAVIKEMDDRHCPEPVEHPNLLVVGDYLFDSTLNGVLDSAQYVALWLCARMLNEVGEVCE